MSSYELVGGRSQDSHFRMLAEKDSDALYWLHSQGYHDACGPECASKLEIPNGPGYLTPDDQNPLSVDPLEYSLSISNWEQEEEDRFEREKVEHFENIEAELAHWDDVQEVLLRRKRARNRKLS